jgi:D-alanyl-D-alanine endopeptidase (penicillin-binding protein 7)
MRSVVAILCLALAAGPALATGPAKKATGATPSATQSAGKPRPLTGKAVSQKSVANKPVAKKPVASNSARSGRPVTKVQAKRSSAASGPTATPAQDGRLTLAAGSAIIVDQSRNEVVYEKNSDARLPIASITKLMTAMVVLDARLPLFEEVEVNREDVDWLKGTRSRLPLGTSLTRHELLYLALVSSENRAASALARSYPGGKLAFVAAMNRKAQALGMDQTRFADPTGLDPANTSTARDLLRMVETAYSYPIVRQITTTPFYTLSLPDEARSLEYRNTNRFVREQSWAIGLSKTGYLNEAGRCLVMQADIADRPLLIVLLNGPGRATPFADVVRLRQWLQSTRASTTADLAGTVG